MKNTDYTIRRHRSAIDKRDEIVEISPRNTLTNMLTGDMSERPITLRVHEQPGFLDPSHTTRTVTREHTLGDYIFGTEEERLAAEARSRQKDREYQERVDREIRQQNDALMADMQRRIEAGIREEEERNKTHAPVVTGQRDDSDTWEYRKARESYRYEAVPAADVQGFVRYTGRYLLAACKGYGAKRRVLTWEHSKKVGRQLFTFGPCYWRLYGSSVSEEMGRLSFGDRDSCTVLDENGDLWHVDLYVRQYAPNSFVHIHSIIEENEWTPIPVTEHNAASLAAHIDVLLADRKAPFRLADWLAMSTAERENLIVSTENNWTEQNKENCRREQDLEHREQTHVKVEKAKWICRFLAWPFLLLPILWVYIKAPIPITVLTALIGAGAYGFGFFFEFEWPLMPYLVDVFFFSFLTILRYDNGFFWGVGLFAACLGVSKLANLIYERLERNNNVIRQVFV